MKIKTLLPLFGIVLFIYIILSTGPTKIISSIEELNKITLFILALIGALLLTERLSGMLLQVLIPTLIILLTILFFIGKKRSKFILLFVYNFLIPSKLKLKAKESFHSFYDN